MIQSFKCKDTEKIFYQQSVRRFQAIEKIALRKLVMLDAAITLETLRQPPSNHLEALSGKRNGQYSIRINLQWRVCFTWVDGAAHDVEIVDYH